VRGWSVQQRWRPGLPDRAHVPPGPLRGVPEQASCPQRLGGCLSKRPALPGAAPRAGVCFGGEGAPKHPFLMLDGVWCVAPQRCNACVGGHKGCAGPNPSREGTPEQCPVYSTYIA
jgi:hypothetical protein